MAGWLADREERHKSIVWDGTIGGLVNIYLTHPESTYHQLRENTRRTYQYNVQKLNHSIGERRLKQLNGIDFRRRYQMFKEPKQEGGRERISGAHHLMNMLGTVLSFGVELGLPDAKRLRDALSAIRFPKASARLGRRRYSPSRYSGELWLRDE